MFNIAQCGNLQIFVSLQKFSVKMIFENFPKLCSQEFNFGMIVIFFQIVFKNIFKRLGTIEVARIEDFEICTVIAVK